VVVRILPLSAEPSLGQESASLSADSYGHARYVFICLYPYNPLTYSLQTFASLSRLSIRVFITLRMLSLWSGSEMSKDAIQPESSCACDEYKKYRLALLFAANP
jgi:hypothetical protein